MGLSGGSVICVHGVSVRVSVGLQQRWLTLDILGSACAFLNVGVRPTCRNDDVTLNFAVSVVRLAAGSWCPAASIQLGVKITPPHLLLPRIEAPRAIWHNLGFIIALLPATCLHIEMPVRIHAAAVSLYQRTRAHLFCLASHTHTA